jgi:hypothetical protein
MKEFLLKLKLKWLGHKLIRSIYSDVDFKTYFYSKFLTLIFPSDIFKLSHIILNNLEISDESSRNIVLYNLNIPKIVNKILRSYIINNIDKVLVKSNKKFIKSLFTNIFFDTFGLNKSMVTNYTFKVNSTLGQLNIPLKDNVRGIVDITTQELIPKINSENRKILSSISNLLELELENKDRPFKNSIFLEFQYKDINLEIDYYSSINNFLVSLTVNETETEVFYKESLREILMDSEEEELYPYLDLLKLKNTVDTTGWEGF